jgi:phenylacetate-CoA ligase
MPIWNEKFETMSRAELEQEQLERLQQTLGRVYRRVSYYHNLFNKIEFDPLEITCRENLSKIPFTTKETLRIAYPYDMFAVPLREVVRMQSTFGTTGQPLIVGYTHNDIDHWSELTARVLAASGVTKDDIVQISFPYGLFTGGLGFHYGAELIGASVIPCSDTDIENQIIFMRDYRTTVLCCAPTFAAQLLELLDEKSVTPAELALSKALFGAESWNESFRTEIEEQLDLSVTDNYGLTEVMGPGVSYECEEKKGLHISEDHFIPEIIDPDSGEILTEGKKGELVITTITKEAYPLIRYRTGDITSLITEPCTCGRGFTRMTRVFGRIDDMIILNGQNMFPTQFEQILTEVVGKTPNYQLVVDRKDNIDQLEIQIEVSQDIFDDEVKTLNRIERDVVREVKEKLGFVPRATLVEPRSIVRRMKQSRVIDLRRPD